MIQYTVHEYLKTIFFIWGILFTIFQVSVLPFIMRHSNERKSNLFYFFEFCNSYIIVSAMVISGLLIYISSTFFNR